MTNINPETGIRYGIISAQSIDDYIIDDIYRSGIDVTWAEARDEAEKEARAEAEDPEIVTFTDPDDKERWIERRVDFMMDHLVGDIEEPVIAYEEDGVKVQTTWLGGAMMLWVFESPYTTKRSLCSPSVPGAVDLNSDEYEDGYEGYDVPSDWRRKDEP